jgi:hypothetical protein
MKISRIGVTTAGALFLLAEVAIAAGAGGGAGAAGGAGEAELARDRQAESGRELAAM